MTTISEIYDAIVDVLEANLAGYARLPNPYIPTVNSFLMMSSGFGLSVGPGADTNREGCRITWERSFNILLAQQVIATENDIEAREGIERDLLDKHDILRKVFYNHTLSNRVFNCRIVSDSGIFFYDSDRLKFLGIELLLGLEYIENVNS